MYIILVGVLVLTSYIPFSMQPSEAYLSLRSRFFRSSKYLIDSMSWDQPLNQDAWKRLFYAREVKTLPQKLGAWGKVVNTSVLSDTTPEQLQTLSINLQSIAYRIQELMDFYLF